jgi:hypothetical protein
MKTYQNKKSVKDKYLKRVSDHEKADNLIQGYGYWKHGKGCALGCTMQQDSKTHQLFHAEIAPEWFAHLIDHTFEALPKEAARKWTYEVLEAIPIGIPYERMDAMRDRLQIRWLKRNLKAVTDKTVNQAVKQVISLLTRATKGDEPTIGEWSAARLVAESAALSAALSAARSAARLVALSAALSAAKSAARLVAESSARSAAESAAESAARSAARLVALSAAKSVKHTEAKLKRRWILTELQSLTNPNEL